jgi:hypothetical protein
MERTRVRGLPRHSTPHNRVQWVHDVSNELQTERHIAALLDCTAHELEQSKAINPPRVPDFSVFTFADCDASHRTRLPFLGESPAS